MPRLAPGRSGGMTAHALGDQALPWRSGGWLRDRRTDGCLEQTRAVSSDPTSGAGDAGQHL